jgi:hypothetical protein
MTRAIALVGVVLIVLTGCARPTLDQAGRQALAAEAAAMLSTIAPDEVGVSLPRDQWPPTILSLEPQDVRATASGLYVSMGSFLAMESGYFVPRNEAAFSPMAGGDPSYRSLGDGVYWFEIKG